MASMADLVRLRSPLDEADLAWLRLLVAEWRLLSDLSFSDLLLYVLSRDEQRLVVVAAQRPTTGPTALVEDHVGREVGRSHRPLVDAAFRDGARHRRGDPELADGIPVRVEAIPVRRAGRVLAVVLRTGTLVSVRMPSRLELAYQDAASLLAQMMVEGRFPSVELAGDGDVPRVGDGFVRLDPDGVVTYASPNAVSAYRSLGLVGDLLGASLGETTASLVRKDGPTHESLAHSLSGRSYRLIEITGTDVALSARVIPLALAEQHSGAIVMVRDVTDVRDRERQLLTKEATIREIHHRVKNNLQTVAALLRLQARRVDGQDAREALGEAERRIGTIAIVHEVLASTAEGWIDFDEVVDQLLTAVPDMLSAEAPPSVSREGSIGVVRGEQATSLAMVLTELLTNAARHAFPKGAGGAAADVPARVVVRLSRDGDSATMAVTDNGAGLPDVVSPGPSSLGLQIVRTLLADLAGRLELSSARPNGAVATVTAQLGGPPTT